MAPDAGGDLSTEPTAEEPLGTRVGGRIRQRRRELGRKLAEVAADAGLSVGYLSSIEKGGKVPSLPVLARLSHRSTVHTDGWQAYWTVGEHGYTHERTVMRQQGDPAHVVMPGVHRVASLLQRWLLGSHQGRVSPEHLDAYLNEFTFRFNRRRSRRRGLLFYRLLEQAVVTDPVTYRELVVNPPPTGPASHAPSTSGSSRRRRPSLATREASNLTQMGIPYA